MLVTFGLQTLTGSAQPVLGDVLTAALPVPQDGVDPIVTVASTTFYQVGFRITVDPYLSNQDSYKVVKILSGTTMQCSLEGSTGHAHANSAIIALAIAASDVVVQPVSGGAGAVIIGADNTVTATPGGSCVYVCEKTAAGVEPNPWHMAQGGQSGPGPVNTGEAWMIGTAADKVIVYALVI